MGDPDGVAQSLRDQDGVPSGLSLAPVQYAEADLFAESQSPCHHTPLLEPVWS